MLSTVTVHRHRLRFFFILSQPVLHCKQCIPSKGKPQSEGEASVDSLCGSIQSLRSSLAFIGRMERVETIRRLWLRTTGDLYRRAQLKRDILMGLGGNQCFRFVWSAHWSPVECHCVRNMIYVVCFLRGKGKETFTNVEMCRHKLLSNEYLFNMETIELQLFIQSIYGPLCIFWTFFWTSSIFIQ